MIKETYSIPLSTLAKEFSFEEIYLPDNYESIRLTTPEVSRPGLALAGFFEMFEAARVQLIGNAERRYLETLSSEERNVKIRNFRSASGKKWFLSYNTYMYRNVNLDEE